MMVASPENCDVHYPVMLSEVLDFLSPKDGGVYVDGTFGAGGYTSAILDKADCTVYAIDRDETVLERVAELQERYGERFVFLRGCFGDVEALLRDVGVEQIDGFVLDVGVSSMQLDQSGRGFSFREDGPLDMRMDTSSGGETAADIVNTYEQEELANLIYEYGEERKSRQVARKIIERRIEKPFSRTLDLAEVVRSVVPKSPKDKTDSATRTFQALRIAVNDEIGELERALSAAETVLSKGGRLVVVSFHSLEDRCVKKFLQDKSQTGSRGSRHMPDVQVAGMPVFELLSRKAVKPSDEEVASNPRSRSARLRAASRLSVAEEGGV